VHGRSTWAHAGQPQETLLHQTSIECQSHRSYTAGTDDSLIPQELASSTGQAPNCPPLTMKVQQGRILELELSPAEVHPPRCYGLSDAPYHGAERVLLAHGGCQYLPVVECNPAIAYLYKVVALSGWKCMLARIAAAVEERSGSADLVAGRSR
jgi:hypothetical protein